MITLETTCRRELFSLTRASHAVMLGAALIAAPINTYAQTARPVGVAVAPDTAKRAQSDSSELVPLFGLRDLGVAAGFALATVVMFKVDKHVAQQSQEEIAQANRFFKNFSKPSEIIAWPGALVIGGGLYTVGKVVHKKRVAEVGWHGTEAVLLANSVTNLLKGVLGRARPYVVADTNPHDFRLGGGFNDDRRTSFPSGHTTTAFAAASAVSSEVRSNWPHAWWSATIVPATLYGGATMVGLSRMYHNKHWASDVVLGAAIGTFSGIKVIQYTHEHPHNKLDRLMLHTSVAPDGKGGARVSVTLPLGGKP